MALARAPLSLRSYTASSGYLRSFNRGKKIFLINRKVPTNRAFQQDALSPYQSVLPIGRLEIEENKRELGRKTLHRMLTRTQGVVPQRARALEVLQEEIIREDDYFDLSSLISMADMMAAGVHYGHKRGAWCGAMRPYLFGHRSDVHIFNLDETAKHLLRALNVLAHIVYRKGSVIFVNTRKHFQFQTQKMARDCGEYFAVGAWKRGAFTNAPRLLGTTKLPDVMVCLSVPTCHFALMEAAKMSIPAIGVCDSDCFPGLVTYPIPGNDDTPTAVELYLSLFQETVRRAKEKREADIEQFLLTRGSTLEVEGMSQQTLELVQSADMHYREMKILYHKMASQAGTAAFAQGGPDFAQGGPDWATSSIGSQLQDTPEMDWGKVENTTVDWSKN